MNVVIAQSGGPTPVINMSLRGAVEQAVKLDGIQTVYGSRNGVEGILENRLVSLKERLAELERASNQPGAILGGSRRVLSEEDLHAILSRLEEAKVDIFCYIGGNGSSRTVKELHHYAESAGKSMRFVHIPKTIDNDLFGTDHTPGYGSAAKFVSQIVQWIGTDMLSMKTYDKVELIEVMGGNSGWLAAASALFKQDEGDFPQIVYMPEQETDAMTFLAQIENAYKSYGCVMAIIPDHMKIRDVQSDLTLNHIRQGYNGGVSNNLAAMIRTQLGLKARVTAPGTLFRSAAGMASECDLSEAYRLGAEAVRLAAEGFSGGMVSLTRHSNDPYFCQVDWKDLKDIAGKEKTLPDSFWNMGKQMPTQAFRDYLTPLVDGQISPPVFFQEDINSISLNKTS